jgi:hypothetical protein
LRDNGAAIKWRDSDRTPKEFCHVFACLAAAALGVGQSRRLLSFQCVCFVAASCRTFVFVCFWLLKSETIHCSLLFRELLYFVFNTIQCSNCYGVVEQKLYIAAIASETPDLLASGESLAMAEIPLVIEVRFLSISSKFFPNQTIKKSKTRKYKTIEQVLKINIYLFPNKHK